MKILSSPLNGFCFGVKNAIKLAEDSAGQSVCCLGDLSHNERTVARLAALGIKTVNSPEEIDTAAVIIRSHGESKEVLRKISERGIKILDATCPFVKKIHDIVDEYYSRGYRIAIAGNPDHPEVQGTNGWCGNEAIIIDENTPLDALEGCEKLCLVAQTTFSTKKYAKIIKKFEKLHSKTVEIFDTICYTTCARQKLAAEVADKSDVVLVIGSKKSSNTRALYDISSGICPTHFVDGIEALKKIKILPGSTVGILAGASTPDESIMEVKSYMSQNVEEISVSEELKAGVEESLVSYREGKKVKGTIISADDKGIRVNIGGKYDGIIYAAEASISDEYRPEDYVAGTEVEAMIIGKKDADTDCIPLSKKKIDLIKEGDKVIESIRGGEVFELLASSATKGGLLGKLGTYTVFIPASQIREKGFPKDLNAYVKKQLRLTVIDIDDAKHKIIASQKKVLVKEREEREEIFWTHVKPNVVVSGTVKRITNFGAFVSVDGFDCLAHIVDLSWNHIKSVEEVLQKDQTYDFIVLSADREKGRVSLGYKQLQPHPFTVAMEKHPIGSICKGKVVSIVPFGAFVQIEPNIEGLVHVSEAAHNYVKNINEVVKVGDEVDVMVLAVDEAARRITLSMKACHPEEAPAENAEEAKPVKEKRERKGKNSDEQKDWTEDSSNNPFAALLKDVEIK